MSNAGVAGFDDLVAAGGALPAVVAADKAALLEQLATVASVATGINADAIFERLRLRESLGSTGFGGGAAIPHARFAELPGIFVAVARLVTPLAFDALDDAPVDIAVLLLSPENAGADHLKALARISRTLRDPVRLAAMRTAATADTLRAAIAVVPEKQRAA